MEEVQVRQVCDRSRQHSFKLRPSSNFKGLQAYLEYLIICEHKHNIRTVESEQLSTSLSGLRMIGDLVVDSPRSQLCANETIRKQR